VRELGHFSAEEKQVTVAGMKAADDWVGSNQPSGMHGPSGWPTGSLFGNKADYNVNSF
jgi:hypothetical protein